ncbi:cytochrome c [Desulfobacterota bacterium AH_259_B03_O07]|nr:cytochrome c [Desulfobacterota bacterium AH_259_B03_O07]
MKTRFKLSLITKALLITLVLAIPNSTLGSEDKSNDKEELHENGEELFQSKGCVACHTIGKGKLTGPDLLGVTERREEEWLRNWLKNPDTMIFSDPIAKELLKEYFVPMPNQGLTDEDIEVFITYFKYEDSNQKEVEEKD